jgi:hypothetical protein
MAIESPGVPWKRGDILPVTHGKTVIVGLDEFNALVAAVAGANPPATRIRMNVTRKVKASATHVVELTVEGPDGDWVKAEHKRLFAEIEADYPREE